MAINIPATVYRDSTPPDLTEEQEKLKKDLYDKIPARRKKFIDKIGYENWDPFPKPNDPMEIRRDVSKRTSQELFREYFQTRPKDEVQSNAYRQAVLELAIGIIGRGEKYLGFFYFSVWDYHLLQQEGYVEENAAQEKEQ